MQRPVVNIPPLSRFNLPQVLDILKDLGVERVHLIDYLKTGNLKAVCFPFRQEPGREVAIEPEQWEKLYPDDWDFSVYDGWIGDKDYEGSGEQIPLHVLPDKVDGLRNSKTPEGESVVTSAPVFILSGKLQRFVKWLACQADQTEDQRTEPPSATWPRKRSGRPREHDYTDVDRELERLYEQRGRRVFDSPGEAINYLRTELGNNELPPDSTLRNHVVAWTKHRLEY